MTPVIPTLTSALDRAPDMQIGTLTAFLFDCENESQFAGCNEPSHLIEEASVIDKER